MNKCFPPFFTRLYSSLFFAIFASVLLTFLVLDQWNEKDAVEDFIADTVFIKKILETQRHNTNLDVGDFYHQIDSDNYPFDVDWLSATEQGPPCDDCEYVNKLHGVEVYERESGAMLSLHSFPNSLAKLIIMDKPEEGEHGYNQGNEQEYGILPDNMREEPFDVEEFSLLILLSVIVIVIGLVLYLPLRKLQKEINYLDDVSEQFGQGNLQVRANNHLSEPLTSLAKSFNAMADSLSSKVNESQVFAQAVPHELRTPLSRMQLATGILRKQGASAEQITLVDNIDQYIDDLDELCGQVIQFSQLNIQINQADYQHIDVNDFIEHRLEQLQLDKNVLVTVNLPEHASFYSHTLNLRLIIDNMLKNAVNHARNKVVISVVQVKSHEKKCVEIVVEDDGVGISAQDYETIFIPYSRLDNSRSRKTGGLGMGLAITKSSVQQLGGEIAVEKANLGGAKFVVTLPN